MTVWRRIRSAPMRRVMGAVVVHNLDNEPVILRDALVLVWDALGSGERTEDELLWAVSASTDREVASEALHQALEELRRVGLTAKCR